MRVEHYIAELLYRYNCVVMPNFGAFLANTVSARIDSNSKTLFPPTKALSFNGQLTKNDGLLISHIANAKKLPYDTLLDEVEHTSKQWKEKLEQGGPLILEGIGKLWLGKEQKIQFAPEEQLNYLTASFGLSPFSASPILREKTKKEVEALEERVPFMITPEQRKTSSLRHVLKYAALLLMLFSAGVSGYLFHKQHLNKQQLAVEEAQEQVSKYIQEATFFDGSPLKLPALNLTVNKKMEGPKHHIIAGAFRIKENSDKKIAQLRAQGYQALYLGANAYGLHQVAYASFSDSQEALRFLRQIKRTVSQDAWMLSE